MSLQLSEDDIDDLLYFARTGELEEFTTSVEELCNRQSTTLSQILLVAKDEHSGNGPVHMAAANGHTEILQSMIKALSIPSPQNPLQLSILNAQNAAGNTPLHWAALNGHLESVKALIDSGADPTITNNAGHDAIYEAELNDKKDVVDWVLKEGAGLEEGIGRSGGEEEQEQEQEQEQKQEDLSDEENGEGSGGLSVHQDGLRSGVAKLGLEDRKDSS